MAENNVTTQLVWLRSDLRLHDNEALSTAMDAGPTVACFVCSPEQWREHDVGDARLSFLRRTLEALSNDLAAIKVPLKFLSAPKFSDVSKVLVGLADDINAEAVFFNAEYPLNERKRDSQVTRALEKSGRSVHSFDGSLVLPPGSVLTGSNDPYTVFTPFKKRWLSTLGSKKDGEKLPGLDPLKPPKSQKALKISADAVPDDFDGVGMDLHEKNFPGGEKAALKRLKSFFKSDIADYHDRRDIPAEPGTSSLSPYLSVGALSPRQCFAAAGVTDAKSYADLDEGPAIWLSEIIWREFYRHVIAQYPHVSQNLAFKRDMKPVAWRYDEKDFAAWCKGETGYPIVDAAQRQLLATGWMHNRLRMITAMFLTKHLLIDWRWGEAHFMRELVDGDFASNNGGWQWSASTGTDAAPYFRIFNPITQAKRFDGSGEFIHEWVPELRGLSGKDLLEPWRVEGHDYPAPIVDHKFARERALDAFKN